MNLSCATVLAVYISLAMESIGDITASAELSRVDVQGIEFDSRIQGGILVRQCFMFCLMIYMRF